MKHFFTGCIVFVQYASSAKIPQRHYFRLKLTANGEPTYTVNYKNKAVVLKVQWELN
jgi:hypothetical protein